MSRFNMTKDTPRRGPAKRSGSDAPHSVKPKVEASRSTAFCEFDAAFFPRSVRVTDRDVQVDDVLNSAREQFVSAGALKKDARKAQQEGVAHCCDAARLALSDDDAWELFRYTYARDMPGSIGLADRKEALRFALLYATGDEDKKSRKYISLFYRAVAPLFQQGMTGREIIGVVRERRGFRELAAAHKACRSGPGRSIAFEKLEGRGDGLKAEAVKAESANQSNASAEKETVLTIVATPSDGRREMPQLDVGAIGYILFEVDGVEDNSPRVTVLSVSLRKGGVVLPVARGPRRR